MRKVDIFYCRDAEISSTGLDTLGFSIEIFGFVGTFDSSDHTLSFMLEILVEKNLTKNAGKSNEFGVN
jgi:hypothetical protein